MSTVEDRLSELELQVAMLKKELAQGARAGDWVKRVSGSQKDEPDFDEVLRLGREIRRADGPN